MRVIQMSMLISLAFAIGCKSSKNQMSMASQSSVKNSDTNEMTAEIQFAMSSTSCFGECPVFNFEFRVDSMAFLNSTKHLLQSGSYEYKLTAIEYRKLADLISSVKWQTLNESYPTNAKDLPTNIFEVKLESGQKKVKQEGLTPQSLLLFKEQILNLIRDFEWQSN